LPLRSTSLEAAPAARLKDQGQRRKDENSETAGQPGGWEAGSGETARRLESWKAGMLGRWEAGSGKRRKKKERVLRVERASGIRSF